MPTDDVQQTSQTPRKRNLLLWSIALAGCVLGATALLQHQFLSNERFYLVQDKDGAVTEIDRRTGRTWRLYRGRKYEVKLPEDATVLSSSLQSEVSGMVVQEDSQGLWIDFYNGTSWTVSEITIRVPNSSTGRLHRNDQTIGPHSKGLIIFDIGRRNVGQSGWGIAEVRGHAPP